MRSPNTFTSRGITKIFYPALSTTTLTTRSHGEYSGQEFSRTGRSPPPTPRLRPIPLPPLDFAGRQIGHTEAPTCFGEKHTTLHPYLTYPLIYSSLSYDISIPPTALSLESGDLFEMAFWPFPAKIEVVCDDLPWTIVIAPSQNTSLTCLTVLSDIHSALTRPVSDLEWAIMSPAMQHVAWGTFLQRVQGTSRFGQGVRRLDFLSSKTWFQGLSPLEEQSDKWMMHLGMA